MQYNNNQELIQERRWQRADNYIGEDLSEYISVVSQSRDSEILDQSNFAAALDLLGGEADDESVIVTRFGHWGCGWFETIMVSVNSTEKLNTAREILNALDAYPVLDDDDLCAREQEDIAEHAKECASDVRSDLEEIGAADLAQYLTDEECETIALYLVEGTRSYCGETFYPGLPGARGCHESCFEYALEAMEHCEELKHLLEQAIAGVQS